jgi:hypothetical protein
VGDDGVISDENLLSRFSSPTWSIIVQKPVLTEKMALRSFTAAARERNTRKSSAW